MLKLIFLFLLLIPVTGCHLTSTTAPAALAPGAVNQFDQDSYKALMVLQASISSLGKSATSDPNLASLKPAINQAATDYNVAEIAWQTYHAAATANNQTAVTAALNQVQADVTGLQKAVQ